MGNGAYLVQPRIWFHKRAAIVLGFEISKLYFISNPAFKMGGEDAGDKAIRAAIQQLQPLVAPLGFGGAMGWCSGYAAKKIGKVGT